MTQAHPIRLAATIALTLVATVINAESYAEHSGEDLFKRFCVSCHGTQGRGDGPLVPKLEAPPPDLRYIARRDNGRFDAKTVERIIDGRKLLPAHGTRAMPAWGEELTRGGVSDREIERDTKLIIRKLVDYLRSVQL